MVIGDAVAVHSPSAIFGFNTSFTQTTQWANRASATLENIDQLTLRTINYHLSGGRKMLRARLHREFTPLQNLVYDGITYRFAGGSLDGSGVWEGTWIELRSTPVTLSFQRYLNGVRDTSPINFG
ncbi:hypothetical protein RZS08_23485, partial [Arthrospira platensis SPKY1]|nr:hypothetical protein [Arthrospira platensis SPKY1]